MNPASEASSQYPLWALTATELAQGYAAGHFSPTDAVEAVLARMAAVNPLINAVIAFDAVATRAAAASSSERHRTGRALGPLDGVPITVKDNIKVAGLTATWGSALYSDLVPDIDELPIARLRAAGAVVIGKTNCPEFTLQGVTSNASFGTTRNPWNLALTPGGSSGGAVAAVAAGIGPVAIATDGGGSIRRPASYTNLVGLKPSRGRVPRSDGFAPILFDYETIGPIARSVADVALVMSAISQPDRRDPASLGLVDPAGQPEIRSARILYVPRFGEAPVEPEILNALGTAVARLRELGHVVEEKAVPFDIDAINAAWPVISQSGLAWLAAGLPDFDALATPAIREMAAAGARYGATAYVDALMKVRALQVDMAEVFATHDFVLTPSAAASPWPVEDGFPAQIDGQTVGGRGHAIYTAFVNLSGCAGVNLPCGCTEAGLPIGMQLVAAPGRDAQLLTIADQCERAGLWRATRPSQLMGA